jgi:hypothetical protein
MTRTRRLALIALAVLWANSAWACYDSYGYGQPQPRAPLKCYTINMAGTLHTYCR